jgi:hypothetical protein
MLLNFVSEIIKNIFFVHLNHHLNACILVHKSGYGLQTELLVILVVLVITERSSLQ